MHPVLADRKRLALYLLAWGFVAVLVALLAIEPGGTALRDAIRLTVPPTLLYAFVCMAGWYQARALPLRASRAWVLLVTYLLTSLGASGIWLAMFKLWARLLDLTRVVDTHAPVFIVAGALLYLLAMALHYLIVAFEEARQIETREMEVKVLAREAELKVLKAQLDPHFLFNSLNSISSLCGSNPATARTLTTLLAEYLRKSLRIGSAQSITLSEELELTSSYLAIERIRFGPRLEVEQTIDESVRGFAVPPLLLQPLVENAVRHGIGQLLDGGVVQIDARRDGTRVRISVENRCDPDRPSHRSSHQGEGIGLANTRRRIATYYGDDARIEVVDEPARFRVAFSLPG
jgi:two-component system sensor histidine kinase AlgZ